MFQELFSGLINKVDAIKDTLKDAFEDISLKSGRKGSFECECGKHFEDCKCVILEPESAWKYKDFVIVIRPIDDDFNFKCYIMKEVFKPVREITLEEIIK